MGFTSETKASDTVYQLEIFAMPQSIDELDLLNKCLAVEASFNENQVINQLSEVTLQMISDGSYRNYLAVASIKIDTNKRITGAPDDGGFYSSALNLYQYQPGKVTMCLNEQLKRSITCLSSY
jgi:hypothetical protein